MRKPVLTILATALGLSAALLPLQQASAARATSITLRTAPSGTVGTGSDLVLAGKVVGGVKGVKVSLQRKTGTSWTTEASKRIPAKLTFRFEWSAIKGKQTYRVTAAKTRQTKASTSKTVSVTGASATQPSFDVTELPDGYAGVLYRFDGFGAKSGWDYSVTAGELPDGLVLTDAPDEGYIDGTPTTPGTYDFTLRITAPGATAVTRDFTIVVHPTGSWSTSDHGWIAAVSNDGTRAVSGASVYSGSDVEPSYLNLTTGTATPIPTPTVADGGFDPESVATSPLDLAGNGRYVLLQYRERYSWGGNCYWMFRWDSLNGDFTQVAPVQCLNPFAGTISADGSVAAWSVNSDIEVWAAATGTSTELTELPGGNDYYPVARSVSDDGRYLLIFAGAGLYLLDRQTNDYQLVDSATGYIADLSRDGSTVVYNDLVQASPTLYVLKTWDRATGTTTVVSRLADGTTVKRGLDFPATISGDGEEVFFSSDRSVGPDGPFDSAAEFMRPYLWDAGAQKVVPLPMITGTSDLPDAREISWTEPSYDGSVVGGSLWEKYGNVGDALFELAPAWVG